MKRSTASVAPPSSRDPSSREELPSGVHPELAGHLHEVSNALTVVLGWLDVARQRLPGGPARDAIEVARTHAQLGHRIARAAIGAEPPPRGSSRRPARSVARAAVLAVTPQAEAHGVVVQLEEGDDGHGFVRDVGAVLQILTNLLLNAIAFTPGGGSVTVGLRDDGACAVFSVRDEGPGIEPSRAATLFDDAQSTREGGAGLGLRHSADLARSHGGSLTLASHAPSATFELAWPIGEALSQAGRVLPPRQPSVAGARVLVVEDDAAVRSLVEFALEARGAQAIVVASGEDFDAIVAAGAPFAAALVDLSPLGDRATSALASLRASSPNVVTILISGVAGGIPPGSEPFVSAWVRKPFEMSEVLQVMGSLLAAPRSKQDSIPLFE
ncbi:MAG TPA: hybrid sensor histidine kinase/response regulator [Polyangiaceae bacterium]